MWPFGRRGRHADAPEPAATPPARGWSELPALQRSVRAVELTAPPERFERQLASWRSPALSGELGHQVAPEAPLGIARGIALPVPRVADPGPLELPARAKPLAGPAVARAVATVSRRLVTAPAPSPPAPLRRLAAGATGATTPAASPPASLAAPAPQAVSTPDAAPDPEVTPAPAPEQARAIPPPAPAGPPSDEVAGAATVAPLLGQQGVPLLVARKAAAEEPHSVPDQLGVPEPHGAAEPGAPRAPRRPGLGAPLPQAQRAPLTPGTTTPPPPAPPAPGAALTVSGAAGPQASAPAGPTPGPCADVAAAPGDPAGSARPGTATPPSSAGPLFPPGLPVVTATRVPPREPAAAAVAQRAPTGPAEVPDPPSPTPEEPPARLLGERPLPLLTIPAEAAAGQPAAATVAGSPPGPGAPARSTPGPGPAAGATGAPAAVRLQRWVSSAEDPGPARTRPGRATGAVDSRSHTRAGPDELLTGGPPLGGSSLRPVRVGRDPRAVQRDTAVGAAAAATVRRPLLSPGARLQLQADPAAAAVATGVATLDADGSVRFAPPGVPAPAAAAAGPLALQRAAEDEPPAPAAAAAGGAAGAAPAGGPTDLDDLARRLYERIRARLRAELRLDLERAGMITRRGR